jgi:hypothetical protein
MIGRRNSQFVTLGMAAFLALPAIPVLAETDWTDLDGTWRGTGLIRETPGSEPETGVCKFKVQSDVGGTSLSFHGRCANATQSGRVNTNLQRDLRNGTITATAQVSNIKGAVQLAGTEDDRSIALTSIGHLAWRQQPYSVHIAIQIADDQRTFSMVQSVVQAGTGQSVRVLEMQFYRQSE